MTLKAFTPNGYIRPLTTRSLIGLRKSGRRAVMSVGASVRAAGGVGVCI